jgi:hypothetical protein
MNKTSQAALNAPTPPLMETPGNDEMLAMILALCAELSAVSDDLDCLRAALELRGLSTQQELNAAFMDPAVRQARRARKAALVDAITLPLKLKGQQQGVSAAKPSNGLCV